MNTRARATGGLPLSRSCGGRRTGVSLLALFLLLATPTEGLFTNPRTIWSLTEEADFVVLAEVLTVPSFPELGYRLGIDVTPVAVLRVQESWKGWAPPVVLVPFEPLVCPAGPVYVPGERVVAFLVRDGWFLPTFQTVGLSFGTRYPTEGEVSDVRDMIRRAEALQERPGHVTEAQRRDWMVAAASRPGTRWDGLYGLAAWTRSVHWRTLHRPPNAVESTELTEQELTSIIEGFLAAPPEDHSLPMALALLADQRDSRIDAAAVRAVERLLRRDWSSPWSLPGWLLDAIALVLERYGDPEPAARLKPLDESFEPIDPAALRAAWRVAKEELGITD